MVGGAALVTTVIAEAKEQANQQPYSPRTTLAAARRLHARPTERHGQYVSEVPHTAGRVPGSVAGCTAEPALPGGPERS
jgi:hypothetical protein